MSSQVVGVDCTGCPSQKQRFESKARAPKYNSSVSS